jgi:hypothetical protein
VYETNLARAILRCAGGHYGKPAFLNSAKHGSLMLAWPMPSVPVPTTDVFELLMAQVSAGIKSLPMAISEWNGVSREGAFQLLEQVAIDNEEMAERVPSLSPERPEPRPEEPAPTHSAPEASDEPVDSGAEEDDTVVAEELQVGEMV